MTLPDRNNQPLVDSFALDPGDAPDATSANDSTVAVTAKRAESTPSRLHVVGAKYALLGVWVLLAAVFAIAKPSTFLSLSSAQAIFGSQAALVFLAISALCTFVVGEFDLSFAAVMGLSATIIAVLAGLHHVNIALSCVIALAVSLGCGVLNAFFIVRLGVPSLVVTLGTSSLFLGLSELISSSNTVSVSNRAFGKIALHNLFGLPLSFYYGLALSVGFAYLLTWMPLGRHIVFVGANREVARLAGIRVDLIRAGSYFVASVVSGLAGMLLVMTVGGFDPTGSAGYLLPALAAVFLGTAMVTPGQFNPMGTFLGIYFLETGVLGLQLLGYTGWVQDAFYGAGLVLAVTVATLVRQHARTT